MSMKRLQGRTAIVTGGASGIGAATATLFASEGANVVIADLDPSAAETLANQITAAGGIAARVGCNVALAADIAGAVAFAREQFGDVHVVVSNAAGGGGGGRPMHEISEDDWDSSFDINVKAGFLLSKEVVPLMKAAGGGSILFTSSLGAKQGTENMAVYGATKAAIVNLVRSMALELGPHGIRVNAVCPGTVLTPGLLRHAPPLDIMTSLVPLGRLGAPEDIANAFVFLASDEASYITGQAIDVDGGMGAGMRAPRPPA
jgi:NAD(P)-dependent dehydrogenase (short-subunit alcohol dehydrogenase family)